MGLEYKDYYKSLGVPRGASEAELKKSFRKLAREFSNRLLAAAAFKRGC